MQAMAKVKFLMTIFKKINLTCCRYRDHCCEKGQRSTHINQSETEALFAKTKSLSPH
jgi:hypothetical protein